MVFHSCILNYTDNFKEQIIAKQCVLLIMYFRKITPACYSMYTYFFLPYEYLTVIAHYSIINDSTKLSIDII